MVSVGKHFRFPLLIFSPQINIMHRHTHTHNHTRKNASGSNRLSACICICFQTVPFTFFHFLFLYMCCSNRVEAWTRDVQFLLRQEGRPVSELVGNKSTVKIMSKDWENTDKATQWIHHTAASTTPEPFALYLGLNLPHPYKTESLGQTAGGSTFRTSPYWLTKACFFRLCFFLLHFVSKKKSLSETNFCFFFLRTGEF